MYKEVFIMFLLFVSSFYFSGLQSQKDFKANNLEKHVQIDSDLKKLHRNVKLRSVKREKESISNNKKRSIASVKSHFLKNRPSEKVPPKIKKVQVLRNSSLSIFEKIDLLQSREIDLRSDQLSEDIILEEMLELSFTPSKDMGYNSVAFEDSNDYLENISPSDEEVYFFELFDALTSIVKNHDHLREVSLDIFHNIESEEVKGLVVLHLLENDVDNQNLNFLMDNISKDKVLSYVPDNYSINSSGIENELIVSEGPLSFDDEAYGNNSNLTVDQI